MSRPVPNPGILDIAPYTPGKSPVPEPGRKVFKLSANETPFGPSPKAIAAYKEAAAQLHDYPEGTSRVLREAIGRVFGLERPRKDPVGADRGRSVGAFIGSRRQPCNALYGATERRNKIVKAVPTIRS